MSCLCLYFETGGAPIDELNCPFAFHRGDGAVDVFGHHVTAVQQTNGHVFPFAGVALFDSEKNKKKLIFWFMLTRQLFEWFYLDHLVVGLETSGRDFSDA